MDERRMKQKISAILAAFEASEKERRARRIIVSSAAAASLTLGLGACPPEPRPPAPDAASVAAAASDSAMPAPDSAAPVLDPAVRALYSEEIPRPSPDIRPRPKYGVQHRHDQGIGLGEHGLKGNEP